MIPSSEAPKVNLFEEPSIKKLIRFRDAIKPEDYPILEQIALISKSLLIDTFHNFFLFAKDKTLEQLTKDLNKYENYLKNIDHEFHSSPISKQRRQAELEQLITIHKIYIQLAQKYHWMTVDAINRAFENRANQPI
jgi:hypothetical protein